MRDGLLPAAFTPTAADGGPRGGVCLSFISATRDRAVAAACGEGGGRPGAASLLLELPMGASVRGADVGWLSQYGWQQELVFAPFTSAEFVGVRVDGPTIVAQLRPVAPPSEVRAPPLFGTRRSLLGTRRSLLGLLAPPPLIQPFHMASLTRPFGHTIL
eukprot:6538569-Prymnesium_polylepis.2